MELYQEMSHLVNELTASVNKLRTNGCKLAEAERDYKVILTQTALSLKASDMPVTLINTTVYGMPEVAEKRLQRDIAQANYDANKEHINSTKLKLRLIEEQIKREWGNA